MRPAVVTAVLLLVGVLDAVTAHSDTSSPSEICESYNMTCGDGWSYASDKYCLKYFRAPKTFREAQAQCVSEGGGLVSIHIEAEMHGVLCFTRYFNPELQTFWIGAQRFGGEFKYLDGSNFGYANWHDGQPDNFSGDEDCVESNFKEWGFLNDAVCSKERPFVCIKKGVIIAS